MKNTPEEISEVRVRALEALIRCEGLLEHRMYECADFYAHNKDSQDVKDLYTLWSGWKEKFPRTAYEQINRLQVMSKRFTTRLDEDDYGDLILTIPYDVIEELGWSSDTELEYDVLDGKFRLKKSEE